jgi:hypothetical protein
MEKSPQKSHSFATNVKEFAYVICSMMHLAEGLCPSALLMLKAENYFICLVGT